jgi:hypothetical protein
LRELPWTERFRQQRELRLARRAASRLPDGRSRELRAVLAVADDLAAAHRLTGSRLTAVMRTIAFNRRAWSREALPRPFSRRAVEGLVWQYRPGSGWQVHPLSSAGRLNALAKQCPRSCRVPLLLRAANALSEHGLEYLFPFGIGRPPWRSAMAQATAAQAFARVHRLTAGSVFRRAAERSYRALLVPPLAVRGAGGQIDRLAMYSFSPGMRVLNGELQMLVGLRDYGRINRDAEARRLFGRLAAAELEALPSYDTGAWTLYSAGGREATVHYHGLATRFAGALCRRHAKPFCAAERRFARYAREPARLTLAVKPRGRAKRSVSFSVGASKDVQATVAVVSLNGRMILERQLALGRGGARLGFTPPRRGRYTVAFWGTAANGRRSTAAAEFVATSAPSAKRRRGAGSRR